MDADGRLDPGKEPWLEQHAGVREVPLHGDRSGLRADLVVGRTEGALLGVNRAVGKDHLHAGRAILLFLFFGVGGILETSSNQA